MGRWGWVEVYFGWMGLNGKCYGGGVDGGERKYILGWWWWVDIFSGWVGMGVYGS